MSILFKYLWLLFSFGLFSTPALAEEQFLTLYSSRHYQTDEALYNNFTQQTGITIRRIEAPDDPLIRRIHNESTDSPADVLLTTDVGRLWRVKQADLFYPVHSGLLQSRIPPNLRDPDEHWFGFSVRARVIAYNKNAVKPEEIMNYEDMAKPRWKGKVCVRSGSHPYSIALTSSIIKAHGEEQASRWVKGLVSNLARKPKGGDTDQLRALATGECQIAMVNSYYYVRLMKSDKPEDRKVIEQVSIVFPNQSNRGSHINISGGGVLKYAPNKQSAIRFLEYMASEAAQTYFANGNNEYTAVENVELNNPQLDNLGNFKMDQVNLAELASYQQAVFKLHKHWGYR